MTIPSSLRIGYRVYRVKPMPADSDEVHGCCNHIQCVIRVEPTPNNPPEAANTLLHEMLHAIFAVYSLPEKELTEETVVSAVANGLSASIQDNKAAWDWIIDQLRVNGGRDGHA